MTLEQTKHVVTHSTNEFPTGLKNAEDVATYIGGISAERVVELADAGYMPHYRIDGGPPQFKPTEVKQWIANNLMAKCQGRALPTAIRVVIAAPPVVDAPPETIRNIPNLQQIPRHDYQPGVYFLCKGDAVVYVGQSVAPATRVATHATDRFKDFDRVYLLPVPASELNDVEAAFIHHLLPTQQGGIRSGRKTPTSPGMSKPKDHILRGIGYDLLTERTN